MVIETLQRLGERRMTNLMLEGAQNCLLAFLQPTASMSVMFISVQNYLAARLQKGPLGALESTKSPMQCRFGWSRWNPWGMTCEQSTGGIFAKTERSNNLLFI
jgi:hypothetical protein